MLCDVTTICKLQIDVHFFRNNTLQVGLDLKTTCTRVPRLNECATSEDGILVYMFVKLNDMKI